MFFVQCVWIQNGGDPPPEKLQYRAFCYTYGPWHSHHWVFFFFLLKHPWIEKKKQPFDLFFPFGICHYQIWLSLFIIKWYPKRQSKSKNLGFNFWHEESTAHCSQGWMSQCNIILSSWKDWLSYIICHNKKY